MNIRKAVDYTTMFTALDKLIAADLPQMELYCEVGHLVSGRPEKGAAVAAAEYLSATYPDVTGFSPRNLRRMREFYRAYESTPEVLTQTLTIGWTQNVVILEAELTVQDRAWYIRAVRWYGWSKLELQRQIEVGPQKENSLDFEGEMCYTEENSDSMECAEDDKSAFHLPREHLPQPDGRVCYEGLGEESGTGGPVPHRIRRHQHRGDWQPGLPPGAAQAGGTWNRLRRQNGPPAHPRRLRPPDWDGPGQPAQYEPHLRRRPGRQDTPAAGLYGSSGRYSRSMVYG